MTLNDNKSKVKLKNKQQSGGNKTNESGSKDDNTSEDLIWYSVFAVITLLAFGTRLYKISEPNHVWYEFDC